MNFNEAEAQRVQSNISSAVVKVQEILHDTRTPKSPSDVNHVYNDKFLLAEYLTNVCIESHTGMLKQLGILPEHYKQLLDWNKSETVYLRMKAQQTCTFIEKKVERIEGNTEYVTEIKSTLRNTKVTEKTIHKVTKYYWKFNATYTIYLCSGSGEGKKIEIKNETCDTILVTTADSTPQPKSKVFSTISLNMNWFLEHIDAEGVPNFNIDRLNKECYTPRRNPNIITSINYFQVVKHTFDEMKKYFNQLFSIEQNHGLNMNSLNTFQIFNPIIPIFLNIDEGKEGKEEEKFRILSQEQANKLLSHEQIEFKSKVDDIIKTFPDAKGVIRVKEVKICLICTHASTIFDNYYHGIEHIEYMLRSQLVSAIGKIVTPADFQAYMEYHNRKLFKPEYQPRPYCYAVRRPKHYPEGTLNIEMSLNDGSMDQPITTQVFQNIHNKPSMHFYIGAATKISFSGDQFLHCWMTHQFTDSGQLTYNLTSRTRQYSCFVLMMGRISGANEFDPKHAVILRNKDELIVPLLFEHLPSAKEFKDAVESLSPEQQRFAKAYRSMQLESTLFALCIVQIKPQLEKLLNLPDQSLTKERRLTQDLMTLFTKYQISSDLVRYDGPNDKKISDKIEQVKIQVKTILTEIDEELNRELEEKKREAKFNVANIFADAEPQPLMQMSMPPAPSSFPSMARAMPSFAPSAPMKRSPPSGAIRSRVPPPKPAPAPVPAPVPAPAPVVQETKVTKPSEPGQQVIDTSKIEGLNYTALPAFMDSKFLEMDSDNALRSSIINLGINWTKKSQASILAKQSTKSLLKDDQRDEKNKAFDLLDALSRSGELTIENTDLHVILPVNHSFDETLINTVIQKNVNPIEKVERSTLLVTSIINENTPMLELANEEHQQRLTDLSPKFFLPAPKE